MNIAAGFNLNINEFSMFKGSKNGKELIETNETLSALQIYDNAFIHLELQKPSNINEITLHIFFSNLNSTKHDFLWFNFYYLFELKVSKNIALHDLKETIFSINSKHFPSLKINPYHIRLREKTGIRLLHTIDEQKCLNYFEEQKIIEIAVEEFKEHKGHDLICVFRKWSPSTWELSDPSQILINKFCVLPEIAFILEENYGIPASNIEICRIVYIDNFVRGDLQKMNWVRLDSGFLSTKPFFVTNDGACFV